MKQRRIYADVTEWGPNVMVIRTAPERRLDADLASEETHKTKKSGILNPETAHPLLLGLPWPSGLPVCYRFDGEKKVFPDLIFPLVLLASYGKCGEGRAQYCYLQIWLLGQLLKAGSTQI